jgi:PIN domain nuclease of toxin-antitoxin system
LCSSRFAAFANLRAFVIQTPPAPIRTLSIVLPMPRDRMIVVQSEMERLPVLTGDPLIAQYAVKTVW